MTGPPGPGEAAVDAVAVDAVAVDAVAAPVAAVDEVAALARGGVDVATADAAALATEVRRLRLRLDALRRQHLERLGEQREAAGRAEAAAREAAGLHRALAAELGQVRGWLEVSERRREGAEREVDRLAAELAALHATRTLRASARLRAGYAAARRRAGR